MGVRAEVFAAYGLFILSYSLLHSCEERVILGRPAEAWVLQLEMRVLNATGGLIPYLAICREVIKRRSSAVALILLFEIGVYTGIKRFAFSYLKNRRVFLSSTARLPLNPSGHTFMFLNGIFILLPVAYKTRNECPFLFYMCCFFLYEYNRLLIETTTYYHTFFDVAVGVIIFCLFRAFSTSTRKAYCVSAYKNEWKEKEYIICTLIVLSVIVFRLLCGV